MTYQKYLNWFYAIGSLLIIGGAVMKVFMGIKFGIWIIFIVISLTLYYQGWVIDKLSREKWIEVIRVLSKNDKKMKTLKYLKLCCIVFGTLMLSRMILEHCFQISFNKWISDTIFLLFIVCNFFLVYKENKKEKKKKPI